MDPLDSLYDRYLELLGRTLGLSTQLQLVATPLGMELDEAMQVAALKRGSRRWSPCPNQGLERVQEGQQLFAAHLDLGFGFEHRN